MPAGWVFQSIPLELETARLSSSLYSKDSTGSTRSWITLKAYDSNDNEVTTAGLANINYASICKTVVELEPTFDFSILGGKLNPGSTLSQDLRLWAIIAPDIAGGREVVGGINLRFYSADTGSELPSALTGIVLPYDASLHTNKIRLIFKYAAGFNAAIQLVLKLYHS